MDAVVDSVDYGKRLVSMGCYYVSSLLSLPVLLHPGANWSDRSVTCRCQMRGRVQLRHRWYPNNPPQISLTDIATLFHTFQPLLYEALVYLWIWLHLWWSLGESCETKEMTWNSILWPLSEMCAWVKAATTWLGLSFFLSPQKDMQNPQPAK